MTDDTGTRRGARPTTHRHTPGAVAITIRLSAREAAILDAVRGDASRTAEIQNVVERWLAGGFRPTPE